MRLTYKDILRETNDYGRDKAILLFRFEEAPEELKALSSHGGDEDWICVIPPDLANRWFPMFENSTFDAGCSPDEIALEDGTKILIGAH